MTYDTRGFVASMLVSLLFGRVDVALGRVSCEHHDAAFRLCFEYPISLDYAT